MLGLSFVVAAHDVAPYVERCLDSILRDTGAIEVIVIDDGSTDHTSELLHRVCDRDARVRVIRNEIPSGPGAARNRGLSAATGTHVWFIDGDDWLLDGAVDAVRGSLMPDTDVLVVDHVRSYPSGRVAPSSGRDLLRRGPDTVFGLRDRPDLVSVLHVPWNKVFGRDFLEQHGLRFSSSPVYEDVSFTYGALLAARRIDVLPMPCYSYRTARPGALTRRAGPEHLVWAFEWGTVLTSARDEVRHVRAALFDRMVWHGWSVLGVENGRRVPLGLRRQFFHRFAQLYGTHRLDGTRTDAVLASRLWALGELRVLLATAAWVVRRARGRLNAAS